MIVDIIANVLAAFFSASVVTTVLQLVFGRMNDIRIAQLRSQLELSNRRILATQDQIAKKQHTQFTWLHQKRAEAMLEIERLICDADDAFDSILRASGQFVTSPDQRWTAAVKAGDEYRKYYRRHRPLFPSEVVVALDKVNKVFVQIANKYQIKRVTKDNEYRALLDLLESGVPDMNGAVAVVEEVFRRLFGVEQTNVSAAQLR